MFALVFFFSILFLFLLSIFFTILGHFLNFIDDIFGISARKNKKKEPELLTDIGVTTPNCPYCNIELPKFPGRKTKCKNCGNYIYVRTRPYDGQRILIKEDEIQLIQDEWAKKNGIYDLVLEERNEFEKAKIHLMQVRHTDNIPDNDVKWYMYNQQRLKYANKGEWHEYGSCCEEMADILNEEKKYRAALELYLESAYFGLCCQGNIDGFVAKSTIKQFHRVLFTTYFFDCLEKTKLSIDEVEQIFYNLNIIQIKFPIDRQEAWQYIKRGIEKEYKLLVLGKKEE